MKKQRCPQIKNERIQYKAFKSKMNIHYEKKKKKDHLCSLKRKRYQQKLIVTKLKQLIMPTIDLILNQGKLLLELRKAKAVIKRARQ